MQVTNDLKRVVDDCIDRDVDVTVLAPEPGDHISPMLSGKCKTMDEIVDCIRKSPSDVAVEHKYDGWRTLVHILKDEKGKRSVKYISRNLHDWTHE